MCSSDLTPAERRDPKILNGTRRARIAKGSGVHVSAVNSLVERFFEAQKMMKSMGRGGVPGLPGMPGFGAGGGRRMSTKAKANAQAAKKKTKSRSGSPAKRAVEDARRTAPGGAALPGGAQPPAAQPDPSAAFQLPDEFKKLLG